MPRTSAIERADLAATRRVARHRDHVAVRVPGAISELADQPPLYALGWLVLAAGVMTRRRRIASTGARLLAAEWLATRAKSALKHRIDRTRPFVVETAGYRMNRGHSRAKPLNSFPSGHSAGAFAVARVIAAEDSTLALPAYLIAGAVSAIQVPRAMHFPTDVVVGALIGWTAGGLVARLPS